MRMLRLLALLALLVAAVAPAEAQVAYSIPNQGILQYSTASVSCSNSTSACSLWSSTIPGAYTATAPNTNSAYSPSFVTTPVPLHLTLQGSLTTNAGCSACVGTLNIGVNYGGGVTGVASIALVNAATLPSNLTAVPWTMEVWVSPVATATGTALPGAGACYVYVNGELRVASNTGSNGLVAPLFFAQHVCGSTGGAFLASAEQLNVIMNWASASLTNSVNVYRGSLSLGN